jgi:AcrR family transcriptional regulator
MSTKQKILEAALALFNQEGATDVTTNLLASALNMSPGNLYYHYRNKEEIIRVLFQQFDAAADIVFLLPSDRLLTLSDLERMIEGNFQLQWQYRFLFRDMMTLIRRDPELEVIYRSHRQRAFENTRQLIAFFANSGVIAPIADEADLEVLTRLVWMVSDFWLPSLELGGETVTAERLKGGVALLRRIARPTT